MNPTPFPAEQFIQLPLPDYGWAHMVVPAMLVVNAVLWIVVVPVLLSKEVVVKKDADNHKEKQPTGGKKMKKSQRKTDGSSSDNTNSKQMTEEQQHEVIKTREVPLWGSSIAVVGLMTSTVVILAVFSPYNSWLPRRVFEAPLLTRQECDEIVARSLAAAERNVKQAQARIPGAVGSGHLLSETENKTLSSLLEDPTGWQKSRHGSYPTTDLNLVTDPFTKEDREFIGGLLDRRLSPLLARLFGIPIRSIRSNDMFVVRYDHGKRAKLANHSDDGDISFNILLTDTFSGGGTQFWHRLGGDNAVGRQEPQPFAHVQPTEPGTVLAHSALLQHEGYPVDSGTRMILVGFTSVDRVDPWRRQQLEQDAWTGLSWLASFANFNWMTVKVKDSVKNSGRRLAATGGQVQQLDDQQYVRFLFRDLHSVLRYVVDRLATHTVTSLVDPDNKHKFLQALDQAHDNDSQRHADDRASWFKGQQINLNLDGSLESEWGSRAENLKRFEDL